MMSNNRVSIVVPVYNTKKYIGKCIQSIQAQSYQIWDLILVDDGSTDGSANIIDSYAREDHRIIAIHQLNRGSVEARKAGVFSECARKNPFLLFCDSDDVLPKHAINKLVSTMQNFDADLVCDDMQQVWGEDSKTQSVRMLSN